MKVLGPSSLPLLKPLEGGSAWPLTALRGLFRATDIDSRSVVQLAIFPT